MSGIVVSMTHRPCPRSRGGTRTFGSPKHSPSLRGRRHFASSRREDITRAAEVRDHRLDDGFDLFDELDQKQEPDAVPSPSSKSRARVESASRYEHVEVVPSRLLERRANVLREIRVCRSSIEAMKSMLNVRISEEEMKEYRVQHGLLKRQFRRVSEEIARASAETRRGYSAETLHAHVKESRLEMKAIERKIESQIRILKTEMQRPSSLDAKLLQSKMSIMMLMNRLGVLEVCSSAKREIPNHLIFLCYYTKHARTQVQEMKRIARLKRSARDLMTRLESIRV